MRSHRDCMRQGIKKECVTRTFFFLFTKAADLKENLCIPREVGGAKRVNRIPVVMNEKYPYVMWEVHPSHNSLKTCQTGGRRDRFFLKSPDTF